MLSEAVVGQNILTRLRLTAKFVPGTCIPARIRNVTVQLVGMTQLRKVPPEENAPSPNTSNTWWNLAWFDGPNNMNNEFNPPQLYYYCWHLLTIHSCFAYLQSSCADHLETCRRRLALFDVSPLMVSCSDTITMANWDMFCQMCNVQNIIDR